MTCICCGYELDSGVVMGLLNCSRCGYARVRHARPNPYTRDQAFAEHYTRLDATSEARSLSALRLAFLQSNGMVPGQRIIDIGCATGAFLESARSYGYRIAGFDCSPWMVERACEKGLPVQRAAAESLNGDTGTAHGVTLFDVLEHLTQPVHVLKNIHRYLVPPGLLVISTPDATGLSSEGFQRWRHYKPREHIHYFTESALVSLVTRHGFRVRQISRLESEVRLNEDRRYNNIVTVVAQKEDADG